MQHVIQHIIQHSMEDIIQHIVQYIIQHTMSSDSELYDVTDKYQLSILCLCVGFVFVRQNIQVRLFEQKKYIISL